MVNDFSAADIRLGPPNCIHEMVIRVHQSSISRFIVRSMGVIMHTSDRVAKTKETISEKTRLTHGKKKITAPIFCASKIVLLLHTYSNAG